MNEMNNKTIREIALAAPATTRVFEEFKIDYCCGGRRSIGEACRTAGIDEEILNERIEAVIAAGQGNIDEDSPENKTPAALIDHIVSKHHRFTTDEIARLVPLMTKVATRHGDHYPQLFALQSVFTDLAAGLIDHMRKEEMILFPFAMRLEAAVAAGTRLPTTHFGSVQHPVRMLMSEHDGDGRRLETMRRLTRDYELPADACPSFTALYSGLQDLELDLHRHIHLENNVLFPAVMALEERAATE